MEKIDKIAEEFDKAVQSYTKQTEVKIAALVLQKNGDMTAAAVWVAPEITGLSDWMRPLLDLWNDCRYMTRHNHALLFGFMEQLMCDIYLAGVQVQMAKSGEAADAEKPHPLPNPLLEEEEQSPWPPLQGGEVIPAVEVTLDEKGLLIHPH